MSKAIFKYYSICFVYNVRKYGAYEQSWTFIGTTLSEMLTSVALPISHHFHPSLSPAICLWTSCTNGWERQAIFKPPPENWMWPPGRLCTSWMKNIHDDLSSLDLGIHEARDLAQNRPLTDQYHSTALCNMHVTYCFFFKFCLFSFVSRVLLLVELSHQKIMSGDNQRFSGWTSFLQPT